MEQLKTRQFAGIDLGKHAVRLSIFDEGPGEMEEESFPLSPDEKLSIELLFKPLDLCAERRLTHVEFFRSSCYIQLFGHCYKISQSSQVHLPTPRFRCIPDQNHIGIV